MAGISYQKKEVFHIRLEVGDSVGEAIDLAIKTAGMDHEDFDYFKITAIAMLNPNMVELTLVFIQQDQEI